MTEPRRLFDCLDFLLTSGDKPDLLVGKEAGHWRKYSSSEIKTIVDQLSIGLSALGVGYNDGTAEGRDKVAIISKNRPEWVMVDLAVQQCGAVLTPFYPTIN